MDAANPLFIYVGYPKSGATKLRAFFNQADVTLLMDKELRLTLTGSQPLIAFDENKAKQRFQEIVAEREVPGKPTILAFEQLAGLFYTGHHSAKEIANRIYRFAPHACILISIREQMAILSSIYRWYVQKGGTLPPHAFFKQPLSSRVPRFTWQAYEYDHLIGHYYQLFGRDRVFVYPQEKLIRTPEEYFTDLCRKVGIPVPPHYDFSKKENQGIRPGDAERIRWINVFTRHLGSDTFQDPTILQNRLFEIFAKPLASLLALVTKDRLEGFIQREMAGRYVNSNRRLSEMIGQDLGALGYEI